MKDLGLSSIVDVAGEVLVAEMESDCDEVEGEEDHEDTPMPTNESGMGLPPPTDEDRKVAKTIDSWTISSGTASKNQCHNIRTSRHEL